MNRPPFWDRLSRSRRLLVSEYDDGSPYRDYNDSHYTDHYSDGGNYQDIHDPFRPLHRADLIDKVVVLSKSGSHLLPGDDHTSSALFSDSQKDKAGHPIDVLPKLLSAGWWIVKFEAGLEQGEKFVIIQRNRKC